MSRFLLSAFILMLSFFTTAQAQEIKLVGTASERAAKITEWMRTTLQLTHDQLPLVAEINSRYAQMQDDLVYASGSRSDKMQQAIANDQAKEEELKKILTEDQFTAYKKKKQALKDETKNQAKARQGMLIH